MRRLLSIVLASTAIATPALAKSVDFDCTVTHVVERKEFISPDTFWAAKRPVNTPEYRRITTSDDTGSDTLTYGLGEGKPQNWTMPIMHVGKTGDEKPGIEAWTREPDQWGHKRWVYFDFIEKDHAIRFWTAIKYPDGTQSASLGTCTFSKESIEQFDREKTEEKNQELRDPGNKPNAKAGPKTWQVPIEHKRGAIELNGMMNDAVPIRFALDTGATITNIPYDLAKRLGAKVIREQKFELADGTVVTSQVILIKTLSIGGKVAVDGIEASVSESGTKPLLGKNFLDAFSSYEINNAQSQLILRK